MTSWFQRKRASTPGVEVFVPAFRYGGATSDNSAGSSSVTVSLTAAATRVDGKKDKKTSTLGEAIDTSEVWSLYRQVPELRYTANAIAGRMAQAEPYVTKSGKRIKLPEGEKDPILELITSQMVERMGLNIFMAGDVWLIGLPEPQSDDDSAPKAKWIVRSKAEVKRSNGKATIDDVQYTESQIYMERIWDPHPAFWEEADSPVLSALPILRTIVGLTMSISAQIDSRLAGAGVYWLPNEILNNPKVPTQAGDQSFSDNPVLNALMTAMLLPMEDRSNASSVVPLLFGAPGDWISKIKFDSFATPFDENTLPLLEGNIRRLALGLDAPPELLLGMGDSNHWAAWLVRDEVVQIHVSPRLDLVGDGLTTGFYQPIKKQLGDPDWEEYEVHFDVSGLVQRPNRLADASQLHATNPPIISDKALRDAGGFAESDAPTTDDLAVHYALQIASGNPQLLDNMEEIVAAIKALLDGSPATGPGAPPLPLREPGSLKPAVTSPVPREETPLVEADALPTTDAPV